MKLHPVTIFAAAMVMLTACAELPPDSGFPEVQKVASERLEGKDVRWDRGAPAPIAASAAVAQLLESPLTVDGAVQIAILHNQRLQAAYEALGISEADLIQAGLLKNPTFSAEFLFGAGPVNPSFSVV